LEEKGKEQGMSGGELLDKNGRTVKVWHGWIVVEKREDYPDKFYVEWTDDQGERHREFAGFSPSKAIEFFDNRVGQPVFLLQTPLGAYRVYTEAIKLIKEGQ
jgi:hypothetical protein